MKVINESWHDEFKKRKIFKRANFYKLRNLLVTELVSNKNELISNMGFEKHIRHKDGIYKTPKEIRAFAVKDAVTSINNIRTKFFKFRNKPTIKFRTKRNRIQTLGIPKQAVKISCKVEEVNKPNKKRCRHRQTKSKKKITTSIFR
jgi:hypothetical protein